jgi:tetratricopeptide (TPR) repeat protein
MADDLLTGVLGGEDEQPETEAPQALAGAEAFAAALAAKLSSSDPEVARDTSAFLKEQTRLLETQRRHLEDEHASRLTQLRLTVAAAKRKRYADHVRNWVYTGIALIVLGVLLAAARMTFEAISDHGLVVDDFTVPADFAARGLTGQALAESLASRVAAIASFASNRSIAQSGEVHAAESSVLKVQIPETGVSIDELERFLHRWLGHETVVNGELREEASGSISLELHIAGADPIVVSGSGADLNHLMQTAAERAYSIFDPGNYALYLGVTGRLAEAHDANVRLLHLPAMSSRERGDAYSEVGVGDSDLHRGLSEELLATDIDPHFAPGWYFAAEMSAALGHEEAAVDFLRKALGTRRRDQPASVQEGYPARIAAARARIDRAFGDFAALRVDIEAADRGRNTPFVDLYAEHAQIAALLHDEAGARQDLALALVARTAESEPGSPAAADSAIDEARWDVSSGAGDWAQALDAAKSLVAEGEAAKSANPGFDRYAYQLETQDDPSLAYAEAKTGDTTSATALISQTPTDCYLCVRTRAKIAAVAGDAASADRWFAEAVRQAPDLPGAYFEWGQALLARGDLAGAARELSLAHGKGPHFADALKAWGDVLVKQGDLRQALAKYDEALKYAPSWTALKQARDAASQRG